jgi:hypothetical protein
MKYLILILCAALTSACATNERTAAVAPVDKPAAALGSTPLRTPETVKGYPVGRYVDPDFPKVMHERHTLYRQEESPAWNTQTGAPYSLALGPVARSNPSPSYYVAADLESRNAQQQAYAEALDEQNRALTERIDDLLRNQQDNEQLRREVDQLRQQLEEMRMSSPFGSVTPTPEIEEEPSASELSGDGAYLDATGLSLFENGVPVAQDSLLSQMTLNDELTRLHHAVQLTGMPLFWTLANLHLLPIPIE